MKAHVSLLAVLALVGTTALVHADDQGKKGFKATCPVSGRAAKANCKTQHEGFTIHFCCGNCLRAFKKNPKKFQAAANLQLYQTGQIKLKACPLSGRKLNPATKVEFKGVHICFCCNGCKRRFTQASDAKKLQMVFGNLSKGFEKAKK